MSVDTRHLVIKKGSNQKRNTAALGAISAEDMRRTTDARAMQSTVQRHPIP
jgi:ribosomal protein L35